MANCSTYVDSLLCFLFFCSEILISSEARVITYVNKVGERSEHVLNEMLTSRLDIAKRLKYTKDIMHRLISTQGQPAAPASK
jgi:hypothetical protein